MLSQAKTYDALADSVEAVRLIRDRETNKGKGIGFVLFKTKEAARAALNLNGATIKGREVCCLVPSQPRQERSISESAPLSAKCSAPLTPTRPTIVNCLY